MTAIKNIKPMQGRLLISEPSLQDFYFNRSVILLADHSDKGSFGLIINKPVKVKLKEITSELPGIDAPVFLGGPVKTDNIFYLHTKGEIVPDSLKIMEGLYWGGDIRLINDLIQNKLITSDDIRFFIGYSGWASKQLDRELKEDSWIVSRTDASTVLSAHSANLWNDFIKKFGKDYAIWSNYPSDPLLN